MTKWWESRRFGVMLHASAASVPAWAPIGQQSDWYRAHMGDPVSDTLLQSAPLVETLLHHRRRWGHFENFDDFVNLLDFSEFDPDRWVELARDAGAGYAMINAKHFDGWCWWDAPNTERRLTENGPKRDVVGEFATAAERGRLPFGVAYHLLDWGDPRHPTSQYVPEVVHPQLVDLVDRYGARAIRSDGHWGAGGDHWRSDELIDRLRRIDPELVLNDRWWTSRPTMRSYDFRTPVDNTASSWELCRGIGAGLGVNRAERPEHLLTPKDVVGLLTEVVAKGGHLLLSVGVDAHGRPDENHAAVITAAGEWITRHADLINRGQPWEQWGDENTRYLLLDGSLHVIDLIDKAEFEALGRGGHRVIAVTTEHGEPVEFTQTDHSLQLRQGRSHRHRFTRSPAFPALYRIDLEPPQSAPITLFADPEPSALAPLDLAAAIGEARFGEVVQLGDGVYVGPARIPAGVTVRGLGSHRTVLDGLESPAVVLEERSRLEHCAVRGGGQSIAWLPRTALRIVGDGASLLACEVTGHVVVAGADTVKISSCSMSGVVVDESDRCTIVRCSTHGMGWDCAIDITGGNHHLIESNDCCGALQAIRCTATTGVDIRHNTIQARWWGVQLINCENTMVVGNATEHTMRSVDVDGGRDQVITGNAALDGDSGCLVQNGATNTEISGNHWQRCRVGLLKWDAGPFVATANHEIDIYDP